jgi:hypothetical protein
MARRVRVSAVLLPWQRAIASPALSNRQDDVVLLFGSYPEYVGKHWGFDIIRTNGEDCGLGGGSGNISYAVSSRREQLMTNFGTANFVETNLHGLFWLRLHGETNVLAEVRIR